ncbi:MAG: XapX domain-containing protein [Alsobacter sp.]
MRLYLVSLAAGLLVGMVYALLQVRSPAPPVVALVGLLGILVGEQVPPFVKALWTRDPAAFGWMSHIRPHVFGSLPRGGDPLRADGGSSPPGLRPSATTAKAPTLLSDGERG